jgi:DNA-binding SARP family transcriptional activator
VSAILAPAAQSSRFRLLGTVDVRLAGVAVPVTRPRKRAVLAYLLLQANRYVTADALIEAVWGGAVPSTARAQIQADVCGIRRSLRAAGAPPNISTWHQGYRLDLEPGQLDLDEFTDLVTAARAAAGVGHLALAAQTLQRAIGVWRGPALGDAGGAFVEYTRAGLEDRRLAAIEEWADIMLRLGEPDEVATELRQVRQSCPTRERLAGLLMQALSRTGRSPDALGVARDLRQRLVREHGIDPGRWLQDVERSILTSL